jgi:hypothetical protein
LFCGILRSDDGDDDVDAGDDDEGDDDDDDDDVCDADEEPQFGLWTFQCSLWCSLQQ